MDPNSNNNVVFDDDAIRHTVSASYYGDTASSASESKLNKWLIKTFPFIKDDSTANFIMIIFSVIIITISVVLFFRDTTPKHIEPNIPVYNQNTH